MNDLSMLPRKVKRSKDNPGKDSGRTETNLLSVQGAIQHKGKGGEVKRTAKTIGSDGKLVSQPSDVQRTFTKYGTPVGTPAYIGFDTRFQVSPGEAKELKRTGFYSKEWRKLRSKP